jgi:hypothetical protein
MSQKSWCEPSRARLQLTRSGGRSRVSRTCQALRHDERRDAARRAFGERRVDCETQPTLICEHDTWVSIDDRLGLHPPSGRIP